MLKEGGEAELFQLELFLLSVYDFELKARLPEPEQHQRVLLLLRQGSTEGQNIVLSIELKPECRWLGCIHTRIEVLRMKPTSYFFLRLI